MIVLCHVTPFVSETSVRRPRDCEAFLFYADFVHGAKTTHSYWYQALRHTAHCCDATTFRMRSTESDIIARRPCSLDATSRLTVRAGSASDVAYWVRSG